MKDDLSVYSAFHTDLELNFRTTELPIHPDTIGTFDGGG